MNNQTLAERIDMLYEARLRNFENPHKELECFNSFSGGWDSINHLYLAMDQGIKIRLKPKTVTREITYPEPLWDAPEHRTTLYRAAPEISVRYELVLWHGLDYQAQWLHDGLLHSTKEAAIAHGKALAGVSDDI